MKPQLASFKNLFLETARVYLHNILEDISALKKNRKNRYAVRDIYISAHSLKSQGLVMGFEHMGLFAKAIERIFHEALDDSGLITPELLANLEHAMLGFKKSVDRIEKEEKEESLTEERKQLEAVLKLPL